MDDKTLDSVKGALPLVSPATKFAVLASPNDIGLYCGVMLVGFGANGEPINQEVKYTHGFSLSPSSAKQLQQILALTIKQYEEALGPIPVAPEGVSQHSVKAPPKT
jgi:hypothetical protein